MQSNYKRLGDYIEPVGPYNEGMEVEQLLGISNQKYFQKAKTNTIGINLEKYRIVRTGEFGFNRATTRNGDKISIALRQGSDCIVSPSYRIFRSKDENVLNSEYLMMWFRRPEFDRYARFKSHGSAHEFFDMDEMNEVQLPVPHIDVQRAMVKEYNTITNRIKLNEQLNQKLEETAQTLYRHWFVDFEFPYDFQKREPSLQGQPYKSSGGEMEWCEELEKEIPKGWSEATFPEFAQVKYGKDYKHLTSGKIPLYGSGGIMSWVSNRLYDKRSVLIPRKGSLANIMIVDGPFWSVDTMFYTILVRPHYSNYLFQFLRGLQLATHNVGSAVPSMTTAYLNDLALLKPEDKTLQMFDRLCNVMFNQRLRRVELNESLTTLASTILSKMSTVETGVAGGVVVG